MGNLKDALRIYGSVLPYISSVQPTFGKGVAHRLWTLRLLARHCGISGDYVLASAQNPRSLLSATPLIEPEFILAPFRTWAEYWERRGSGNVVTDQQPSTNHKIWQLYYDTLSILHRLQDSISTLSEHSQTAEGLSIYDTKVFAKAKSQQLIEFQWVEKTHEQILLKQVTFPKANEATPEMEAWIDQVMSNWRILCGPTWRAEDHGEGGKLAMTRRVLDVRIP